MRSITVEQCRGFRCGGRSRGRITVVLHGVDFSLCSRDAREVVRIIKQDLEGI